MIWSLSPYYQILQLSIDGQLAKILNWFFNTFHTINVFNFLNAFDILDFFY